MASPAPRQLTRLIQLVLAVRGVLGGVGGELGLLRMRLRALRNGDHGVLGPDVDGFAPVQALDAAALDGDDVFCLCGIKSAFSFFLFFS